MIILFRIFGLELQCPSIEMYDKERFRLIRWNLKFLWRLFHGTSSDDDLAEFIQTENSEAGSAQNIFSYVLTFPNVTSVWCLHFYYPHSRQRLRSVWDWVGNEFYLGFIFLFFYLSTINNTARNSMARHTYEWNSFISSRDWQLCSAFEHGAAIKQANKVHIFPSCVPRESQDKRLNNKTNESLWAQLKTMAPTEQTWSTLLVSKNWSQMRL